MRRAVVLPAVVALAACGGGPSAQERHDTEVLLTIRYSGGSTGGQDPELPRRECSTPCSAAAPPRSCAQLSELELEHGRPLTMRFHRRIVAATATAGGSRDRLGGGRVLHWTVRGAGGHLRVDARGGGTRTVYDLCYLTAYPLRAVERAFAARGEPLRVVATDTRHPRRVLAARRGGFTVTVYEYALDARDFARGRAAVVRRGNVVVSGPARARTVAALTALG